MGVIFRKPHTLLGHLFAKDQIVLIEPCRFPIDIFEIEAVGIWGACRELSEELS